jgi:hypothetical protein
LAERLVADGISGASDGILTGLAAVGIDPRYFNLQLLGRKASAFWPAI